MFHLHWKGYGLVVGIAGPLGMALASLAIDAITHDKSYWTDHLEAQMCGVLLSGALPYGVVKLVEMRHPPHKFVDPVSGQERTIYRNDSLLLIPIRFLPYTFLCLYAFITLGPPVFAWFL